jgi:cytochrome c-type biogenesis protein CcmH
MIIFWVFAVGLAGLAVLFVVAPLLSKRDSGGEVVQDELNLAVFRRQLNELDSDLEAGELDKTQYKAARRDLERELLYDVDGAKIAHDQTTVKTSPVTALLLALAVPAFSFALYIKIGERDIIPRLEMAATGQTAMSAGHPGAADGQPLPSMDELVARLAAKMEQNPDNLEGWLMLGRSYFAVNQPNKALEALDRAVGLAPENPEVMLAYAQAVAANADGKLAGRPAELIARALEIDPANVTGRWLNGLIAYQEDDFPIAVERWEAILVELDPAGDEAGELREFIADARERGGVTPTPHNGQAPNQTAAAASATPDASAVAASPETAGPAVTVNVSLAESLWKQADVNHTLFVYARAAAGPPMPLAVKRLTTGDLPVTVTLDDSMAMIPAMRLSAFPEVTVGARISASGQATPQSGDLEGEVSPVRPGESGPVDVVIDSVRR